jgi:hypothetical protein
MLLNNQIPHIKIILVSAQVNEKTNGTNNSSHFLIFFYTEKKHLEL